MPGLNLKKKQLLFNGLLLYWLIFAVRKIPVLHLEDSFYCVGKKGLKINLLRPLGD
jgi:hypothetical protein